VGFFVDLFQTGDAHMRVNLRGVEAGVAEQFLHEPQIGTGVEQVRRVTVADLMRCEIVRQIRQREITLQQQLHLTHGQPFVPDSMA